MISLALPSILFPSRHPSFLPSLLPSRASCCSSFPRHLYNAFWRRDRPSSEGWWGFSPGRFSKLLLARSSSSEEWCGLLRRVPSRLGLDPRRFFGTQYCRRGGTFTTWIITLLPSSPPNLTYQKWRPLDPPPPPLSAPPCFPARPPFFGATS